jgi:hypothetical protein
MELFGLCGKIGIPGQVDVLNFGGGVRVLFRFPCCCVPGKSMFIAKGTCNLNVHNLEYSKYRSHESF